MKLWDLLTLSNVAPKLRLAIFVSVGAFFGMVAYVANISNAASYLSDDPKACINCHIMTPHYATWQHSSHGRVATCNDCHVPHDSIARKYAFKAMDGGRHSFMFTFRMEPQVLRAREESKEVIQENCLRCHANVVSEVGLVGHADKERSCLDCHREVPHGRVHSLSSTPNAAVPPLPPVTPPFIRGKQKP